MLIILVKLQRKVVQYDWIVVFTDKIHMTLCILWVTTMSSEDNNIIIILFIWI